MNTLQTERTIISRIVYKLNHLNTFFNTKLHNGIFPDAKKIARVILFQNGDID